MVPCIETYGAFHAGYHGGQEDDEEGEAEDEDKEKEMEITYTKDEQGNGTVVLSECLFRYKTRLKIFNTYFYANFSASERLL